MAEECPSSCNGIDVFLWVWTSTLKHYWRVSYSLQLLETSTIAFAPPIKEVKSHPIITGSATFSQKMSFSITTRLVSLFLLQFSSRSLLTGGLTSSEDYWWSTLQPVWRGWQYVDLENVGGSRNGKPWKAEWKHGQEQRDRECSIEDEGVKGQDDKRLQWHHNEDADSRSKGVASQQCLFFQWMGFQKS